MKNSTKVLLMIIIVVIILILSIFIILQFPNKQKCEKSEKIMEIGVLKALKCISLCPTFIQEELIGQNLTMFRYPDPSCRVYCDRDFMKEEQPKDHYFYKCPDRIAVYNNLSFEGSKCSREIEDPNKNYQPCFDDFFKKYSYIVDLSNYKLGEYPIYNLTIENLKCNNGSVEVTLKLNEGTNNLNVVITISRYNSYFDAPNVGETKTYLIDYKTQVEKDERAESYMKAYGSKWGEIKEVYASLTKGPYDFGTYDMKVLNSTDC